MSATEMPSQTRQEPTPARQATIAGHCIVRELTPPRPLPPGQPLDRERLLRVMASKWVNGTVLHYFFVEGPAEQQQAVRDAFAIWKGLGLGLDFVEVHQAGEAEVRIGFDGQDGSWSYIGRDVLGIATTAKTMNFGWDLTTPYGHTTALHEIGHTLGMPHEHQNPFSGIVWDTEKVYAYFTGSPNFWSRDQTLHNVLQPLARNQVEGSSWDADSVMEYWFPAGLIREPAKYQNGLQPAGGLSPLDKEWAVKFYPGNGPGPTTLQPGVSVPLDLKPAQQEDFSVTIPASRRYTFSTFGASDTVMVLFERVDGQLRFVAGDDDSGQDRNAQFSLKLFAGREYVLRLRLYWAGASGTTTVMFH